MFRFYITLLQFMLKFRTNFVLKFHTNLTLYASVGIGTTAGSLFVFGDSVLLRLFEIFELHSALFAPFLIRISFVFGSIFYLESSLVLPLVLGFVPLAVFTCEPSRFVLGSVLIRRRVQNRQPLRVSHVARFADSEQLSACTGRIGW